MKKVLIIDDSILARMAVKKCLKDTPYEIFEAADGEEGLKKFREVAPDIVISDLTMPKISGFELISKVRELSGNVVIIAMTADTQKKTIDRAMKAGANALLNKPLASESLLEAISKPGGLFKKEA